MNQRKPESRDLACFYTRVLVGDLYEATHDPRDLTAACACCRPMRPRVGRCAACVAVELKAAGFEWDKEPKTARDFRVATNGDIERAKGGRWCKRWRS